MINLLINEYIKTFRKRGFIILLLIMAFFAALTNLLYKELGNITMEDYNDQYIEEDYKNAKAVYDSSKKNRESKETYIDVKNNYDLYVFKNKFENKSWQKAYIERESLASDYIDEINRYELELSDNVEEYELAKANYDNLYKKLNNSDWKDLVKEKLTEYQWKIDLINKELDKKVDIKPYKFSMSDIDIAFLPKEEFESVLPTVDTNSLLGNKKNLEILVEGLNIQLDRNISYSDSMISDLDTYISSKVQLLKYEGIDINDKKNDEAFKAQYYELREQSLKLEYSLKNNSTSSNIRLSTILENFYGEFLLFIVIFIFMVAGPTVSQEFSKGTIKMLLVKPYSRTKILLSKYIVTLSSIILAIIAMFVIELLLGGLFFGFSSLSDKVVLYSSVTDSATYMSIIKYFILMSIAKLPHFIILATITFAMSSITNNTAVSMITGFVAYIGTNLLTVLLVNIDKPWVKYFVGFNWDFKPYMFNTKPEINGLSLGFSALVCFTYLIVFIVPTFIVFKHKDIKNI